MPEITLSLPFALLLLTVFLMIGAVIVFFALRQTGQADEPTIPTPTITMTVTPTITATPATPTPTDTPEPSPTPQTYIVRAGETCSQIAFSFGVSVQSLVLLNNLSANCDVFEGDQLFIPQPTPTATSLPSATLSSADATEQACEKDSYVVQETDTLSSIANAYNVPMAVIQEYNGLTSETVFIGMTITIPLCERFPTPGPSPTPTLPPPYSAPNLLLPPDGARFVQTGDTVTLQWASVGTLLENEAYEVIIVDFTDGDNRRLVEHVTDTKFIVPVTFRSTDDLPHVYRWWVMVARQSGTDTDGNPIWDSAGASSNQRVFLWSGGPAIPTPTP
jgi:LysM repeat protein